MYSKYVRIWLRHPKAERNRLQREGHKNDPVITKGRFLPADECSALSYQYSTKQSFGHLFLIGSVFSDTENQMTGNSVPTVFDCRLLNQILL